MEVRTFTFNPFQTNCYVCHSDGEGVLVDAASSTPEEHRQIEEYIARRGITIKHLLLTHGHIDHIFGCRHFSDRFDMPFRMHRADAPLLAHAPEQSAMFGVPLDDPPEPSPDLDQDAEISFGGVRWRVLHTPGHSPGSVSFYDEQNQTVLAGDVLFAGSIGRTDLWRGSLSVLMESIFQKLVPLGDDVRVLSGHGEETTIGHERRSNPFLVEGHGPL